MFVSVLFYKHFLLIIKSPLVMKKEDMQSTVTYSSRYARETQEKETLFEKFTYWFRDFLESSE